ncbi:hypothetical protein VIGAN_08012400 [Vigna angularis var. angularis]|uniref:Uncharacterized protein n=1 Tax=Vigna angularis var. angularis TaxID=157739 RepID=A0A0S3SLC6_PHAAN|nr:hypothetical protein VIGAN_08012400 [Vigna angularis var. angularis]
MELKNVVKDKKFWMASFIIAWAAALQGHMMWLQRQNSFKEKFEDGSCCRGRILVRALVQVPRVFTTKYS